MIISTIRRLRHGPLRKFSPFWLFLGKVYRYLTQFIPGLATTQYINKYGPYKLCAKFTFSDFEHWGSGHNEGFVDCIEACRGKAYFLDIGAHIGLVSLPASNVVAGKVIAFEPATANRRYLEKHIALNAIENIEVHDALVGASSKDNIEFYEQNDATGMNSRVVKKDHHLYHKTTRQQVSLDDFCQSQKIVPDIIKIDVEGAEYDVIKGATQLLTRHSPIIFLSLHPKELLLMGSSVENVITLLLQLNYNALDHQGNILKEFGFSEYRFIKKDRI